MKFKIELCMDQRRKGSLAVVEKLLTGDVLDRLREFPDKSIDLVLTSPPYYGMRDYKDPRQIGLEPDFNIYIEKLLEVSREIKRVLKDTGSYYLNIGDCYGGWQGKLHGWADSFEKHSEEKFPFGMDKPRRFHKSLMLIPERLLIRLVDEQGWICRNKIIWAKPNPLPSSARDKYTPSWEYVFFLVKKRKGFYYNIEAIKEGATEATLKRYDYALRRSKPVEGKTFSPESPYYSMKGYHIDTSLLSRKSKYPIDREGKRIPNGVIRAKWRSNLRYPDHGYLPLKVHPRDYWFIAVGSYKGAHFAVFPPKLLVRPILASCPAFIC